MDPQMAMQTRQPIVSLSRITYRVATRSQSPAICTRFTGLKRDFGSLGKALPGNLLVQRRGAPPAASGDGGGSNLGGGGNGSPGGGGGAGGNGFPQRLAYGFAFLIAIGGYMGYQKKGSKASLKASASFAVVLLLAGYLIGGQYSSAGLAVALGANLALGGYMVKGFAATKKPFPQGVFSVVSAFNSIIYIKALTGT